MNDQSRTPAFFVSLALHIAVVLVLLFIAYVIKDPAAPPTRTFELVAGAGNNYMAREAPALGDPSVKLAVPKMPALPPLPEVAAPPPPPKTEPPPITPAPTPPPIEKAPPPPPPKVAEKKQPPSIAKQLQRKLQAAKTKATNEVKKEREAEQKRLTKEAFDRENAAKKVASAKTPPPAKLKKIDTAGIKEGVTGGSTANTKGGAGGNALVADDGDEIERYEALLQRLFKEELDQTPAEDGLRAEAELHIMSDGRLTRGRIVKSSGNDGFDRAVLRAITVIRLPPRPKGLDEVQIIPFSTRAKP